MIECVTATCTLFVKHKQNIYLVHQTENPKTQMGKFHTIYFVVVVAAVAVSSVVYVVIVVVFINFRWFEGTIRWLYQKLMQGGADSLYCSKYARCQYENIDFYWITWQYNNKSYNNRETNTHQWKWKKSKQKTNMALAVFFIHIRFQCFAAALFILCFLQHCFIHISQSQSTSGTLNEQCAVLR